MIKRTITVLSMLMLSAALTWAIWEGNAAAGSQEDFPTGLFASSDLFPKYTLIEITNLEQNTTSRAVVIGDMGSDGLLVKVSPDLAQALSIKEGSIARVRVSVPPLVAEEGADPVLLGKVEEKQPTPAAAPTKAAGEVSPKALEPVQPEVEKAEAEKPVAPIAEVEEPIQPEPASEEPMAPIAEVEEPVEISTSSEYSAEAEKPVPDAPPIQEPPMQEGSESSKPVLQVAEITVPETAPELNEFLSPVPEVPTPIEPEPVIADEAKPVKDTEEPVAEPESLAEEQTEETEELKDEPELVIAEEAAAEDDVIMENHVVLVPSEPRAPMKEYIPVPKEHEKPAVPVEPIVTQPAEELYTANVLTRGAFYVQIGWFKDMLNVDSFVQLYGKRYPIAIEKSSTAKDVFYKVYIGPLKKDERGATLETFQKLGFKDAFLKKAP
ncbi:SPOR domain-containing protein [Treponema sp. OMZ 805]|uniref:SPOR domain-containing protein n=1 Tax=Treponema sp. OMZ 805 TaxID=2726068 RepID=UPI003D92A54E